MCRNRKLRQLLVWGGLLISLFVAACQKIPAELEQKQTPFATYNNMLAINVTAHRLTSPTIDNVTWLEQGRISTMAPGNSRLKLLAADRSELFVLDFETVYSVTGSDTLQDTVLLTLIVPYSKNVHLIRVETPQGSDEVLLAEVVDIPTSE